MKLEPFVAIQLKKRTKELNFVPKRKSDVSANFSKKKQRFYMNMYNVTYTDLASLFAHVEL